MKKKVMVGLVSVVVAVALVFGGVTFYNNRQEEKFEKQMASYESVDTMQHPSEAPTSIDGIQVPLGKKPKVTTKKTTKKSTRIKKLKKKARRSKITTRRTTKRRTTTSQNHSRRKVVNTKVGTTTVELSQMSGVSGTTLRTLGSQADGKILNAFEDLKFKMVIDKHAEATGVFSVKSHKIALQSARSSVLLHELGHFANFLAGDKVGTSEWKSIYNAEKDKYDGYNKAYAIKSASEYFAESYKDYKEHPSALRSKRPRTYQFVKSTIDGITDSDVQNIKDTYGEYWGL